MAARAAASERPKETASRAKAPAAMATMPAARPSIPSIRFTRFARKAIHRTVIGAAAQPRLIEPISGRFRWSILRSQPSTGISARATTAKALGPGRSPRVSSSSPTRATPAVPMRMPGYGPSGSTNSNAGTRMPITIAKPPMRGMGFVWTRGLSPPRSIPPIFGASQAVAGVSSSTIATATMKPHATEPSSTRERRESHKDIAERVIAQGVERNEGLPPALAVALTSVSEVLSSAQAFDERIATREAAVGIVGLGYAGLPLAMVFAEAGFPVTGIDISEERVRAVSERRSYLVDVPAERFDHLDGRLRAVTDYAAVRELDAITICVPTPLSKTRTPDISHVVSAAESVAANLRPGQLVVLQSTTYPGSTQEIVLPILEKSGGKVGEDFFLGYAPERVDPGNKEYSIRNTPKLVAGVTDECRRRVELLYR